MVISWSRGFDPDQHRMEGSSSKQKQIYHGGIGEGASYCQLVLLLVEGGRRVPTFRDVTHIFSSNLSPPDNDDDDDGADNNDDHHQHQKRFLT